MKLINLLNEAQMKELHDFTNNGIRLFLGKKEYSKIAETEKALGFITSVYAKADWHPKKFDMGELFKLRDAVEKVHNRGVDISVIIAISKKFNKRGKIVVSDDIYDKIKSKIPSWLKVEKVLSREDLGKFYNKVRR